MYVILQSGKVNTPLFPYLHWVLYSFVRRFPNVLFVVNAIAMFVSLNTSVIYRVSFPTYVNLVLFFFCVCVCVDALFFLLFVIRCVTVWVVFVVGRDLFYGLFFFLSALGGQSVGR